MESAGEGVAGTIAVIVAVGHHRYSVVEATSTMVMANALVAAPSDFAGGNFVNFAVANWFAIPRWTALVNGLIATVPSGSRGGEGDDGGDGGKNGFHGVVVVKSCVESEFVTPIARFIGMTPQPVSIAEIAKNISARF